MKSQQDIALFFLSMSEYEMTDLEQERFDRIIQTNEQAFRNQVEGLRGQQLNHLAGSLKAMIDKACNHDN